MRLKTEEKQELLEEVDVAKRLRRLTEFMSRELDVLELGSKIQDQVQSEMDKSQREYFLRQQLKAIQDELGETDETQAETNELRDRLDKAQLPEEVDKQAQRELDRLAKLPPAAAEYGVIRTYLDWILSLPWSSFTEDNLDIAHARTVLDEDHHDLDDVKDRILEFLAVQKLKSEVSGPILCFAGPPGVGKTSLGKSIARAMGRKFIRISVGGVRDESEIRPYRRTYVGSPCPPGPIIRALRRGAVQQSGSRLSTRSTRWVPTGGADPSGHAQASTLSMNSSFSATTTRPCPSDLSRGDCSSAPPTFLDTINLAAKARRPPGPGR